MEQFPVIGQIHNEVVQGVEKTEVSIDVQMADSTLMFWQPDNVDGVRRYVCREDGTSGTREEWVTIINDTGDIWTWMRQGDRQHKHVRSIFVNPPVHHPSRVGYILTISRYDWYKKPSAGEQKAGINLGKHSCRQICYTVHLPPKEGFEVLVQNADLNHNVELTESLLLRGFMDRRPEFEKVNDRLYSFVTQFEQRVYEKGLKDIIHKSTKRGMSGTFGEVKLMSWGSAGRWMLTFEATNRVNPKLRDAFTIIGNEPPAKANFGWKSIYSTADRAEELVNTVIDTWERTAENKRSCLYGDDKTVKLDALAALGH